MRNECADFQGRRWLLQLDDQPFRTRGRVKPTVGLIVGFAREIKLGHQTIEASFDRQMNVRWPHVAFSRRVAARLDGAKAVATGSVRGEAREPLEVGIEGGWVRVARMAVFPR